MDQENSYVTIDLYRIMKNLLKKARMIALSMLVCAVVALVLACFVVTPLYSSQILLYVNNSSYSAGSNHSISTSEIAAAKSLVETYLVILETRMTIEEVISVGGIDRSYEELIDMIDSQQVGNTEIFAITITSEDSGEVEHIANTIGSVLPEKISGIVDGSSVRIVDYAVVPSEKKSPSIGKYTVIGMLAGLILSCGAVIVTELFDGRIHSEEYLIRNHGEIPLLAVIPDTSKRSGYRRTSYYSKTQRAGCAAAKEAYKLLRTNLTYMLPENETEDGFVIGVASALRGEGKTAVSVNLAHALAEMNRKVLLLEGDMRFPSLQDRLKIKQKPGLSNALATKSLPVSSIQKYEDMAGTAFDILAAGDIPPNPSEMLASKRMQNLLRRLKKQYDYIIMDLPPVSAAVDALVAAKLVEGVIVVVRSNYSDCGSLNETIRRIKFVNGRIFGFVLNGCND